MTRPPKLMVVSQTFPPMVGGSPILLANLLRDYPGEVVAAAGFSRYCKQDPDFLPPCPTAYLRPPRFYPAELIYDRLIQHAFPLIRGFLRRQVRRWKPDVMLGAFPVVDFFIPAYQVARELDLPFYAHMHDLWQENYTPGSRRGKLAEQWEREILTNAKRVLCMTGTQRDHYQKKYGIDPLILPHTISTKELSEAPRQMSRAVLPRRTALFVGSCSDGMNMDALRVLSRAAELLPDDFDVMLCTGSKPEDLAAQGVESRRFKIAWKTRTQVKELQSAAHVLIAPLSHKNGEADEVRTVFSTKLLEYLVSGRPILVFAPADSFHAQSARNGGWGYVVDQDDPRSLAEGIVKLASDEALASSLVDGALAEARRREAVLFGRILHEWVCKDSGEA